MSEFLWEKKKKKCIFSVDWSKMNMLAFCKLIPLGYASAISLSYSQLMLILGSPIKLKHNHVTMENNTAIKEKHQALE